MSMTINLEQEIEKIKARNKLVEDNKSRETSRARKLSIACLTYIIVVLFFFSAHIERPFINAIVPTLGFLLSTLSLDFLKHQRLKRKK